MNDDVRFARPWRVSAAEPHKVLSATGQVVAECNAKDDARGFLGINDTHAAMIVACVNAEGQESTSRAVGDPLSGLQRAIWEWANATFPSRVPAIAFMKLFEEYGEVIRDPYDSSEWADVLFITLDLMAMYGHLQPDAIVRAKLEVNRRRKWGVGPSGTMHNRGESE